MTQKTEYDIGNDFSKFPGGRYRKDGPHSGEIFREDVLVELLNSSDKLVISLDNTLGYGSSFLEETFGGLVRKQHFDSQTLHDKLDFLSSDKYLIKKIWNYIDKAERNE